MQPKRVSLLFLGDPKLDRRIQSFAKLFAEMGYVCTIFHSIPGRNVQAATDGFVQLASRYPSGPRLFLSHHSALRTKLAEIANAEVIIACDLYSLRAASQAKSRNNRSILIYDARELYTGLPAVVSRPFVRHAWKKCEHDGMLVTDIVCTTAPHDADAIFRVHSFLPRPVLIRNIPLRSEPPIPDVTFLRDRGIGTEDRVAVYIGGLQAERGLEAALAALRKLPPNVKLLLLGTGAIESQLRQLATGLGDRVVFGSAVEQDRVLPILAACDVGLSLIESRSPSYELALPSKIFEYLRAGLPVISTELRHVIELFDHQPYMQYVKDLTAENIASTIAAAITGKKELNEVIVQAASQYSFEADFEKLKLLLEERLAERR